MKAVVTTLMMLAGVCLGATAQTSPTYGSNPDAGKYIEANDIRMYYESYGKGEPLLLLHGNGGSIQSFAEQIPALAKHFNVIAIDSRSQGRSTDSDKEITYALMASDVAAAIQKLNLGSVNVVGWSDGGNVGLELALAYPQLVKKLVTISANFSHEHFMADTARSVVMDVNDPVVVKTRGRVMSYFQTSEKLSANPERLPQIRKKLEYLIEHYPNLTKEQLAKISCPALVVAGDHDLIREEHTLDLYKSLSHGELCIIPGATHLAVWEQPEIVNETIIRFLETPYRDIDRFYFFRQ
ncbi:MAG TPA: alpha/beta hydrolase [Bacteroidota bacterium]